MQQALRARAGHGTSISRGLRGALGQAPGGGDAADAVLDAARKGQEARQLAVLGWTGALTAIAALVLFSDKGQKAGTAGVFAAGGGILIAALLVSRIYDQAALDAVRRELDAQGV